MIDIVIALMSVAMHDKNKKDRQRRHQQNGHRSDAGTAQHTPPARDRQKPPHST